MRVLHVLDHTLQFNGMAHAAVDLACAQAQLGHAVGVCRGGGNFGELLTAAGVEIFDVPMPRKNARVLAQTAAGVFSAIKRFKPDVIHAHMVLSAGMAAPIAWVRRIPFITCVQNSFSKYSGLMRVGDLIITGSKAVADDMASRGVPARKLRPILNGTIGSVRRPDTIPPLETLQRPAVITMCGLHPRKGVDDLIIGFQTIRATLPDLHLYILGEGPHEAEYREMVAPEHYDHIHFCGAFLEPRPYLLAADAFVLASLADPAPLALSEAREAGLAIIATNVDGIPEMLDYGAAGILISPKSPNEIATALDSLFGDRNELQQWRDRSIHGIEKFSLKRVAEETIKVYLERV